MSTTKIRRKPVPGIANVEKTPLDVKTDLSEPQADASILLQPHANLTLSPQSTQELGSGDELLDVISPTITTTTTTTTSQGSGKSLSFATAFEDVRHFAGGLVSHPYEATKHYSVLRHSHGLVYFKGFTTSVAVTVFGDRPLPADRQFWLQKRGYSGKTGLRLGASILGSKAAWIDVTPTTRCGAEQLPATDERAWQRDIAKFLKKAGRDVRRHEPRETCVLRIPCSAEDGYFRVVLCAGEDGGKKTLCPSPVFRLVSTSTSMASLRGASLATLPLELGIKIGQFAARQVAVNAAAPVAGRAAQTAKSLAPWQPSGLVQQQVVSTVQGDAQARFESMHEQSREAEQARMERYIAHMEESVGQAECIGPDEGPEAPYPTQFSAKVAPDSASLAGHMGMPTAVLKEVAANISLQLSGTYFGWAKIASSKGLELDDALTSEWHQVILTAGPRSDTKVGTVMKKVVSVLLIIDDNDLDLTGAKLTLLAMGRIRTAAARHYIDEAEDVQSAMGAMVQDIATTQTSLDRPAWTADTVLERIKSEKSGRSIGERYASAHETLQKGVDRVPVHYAGVRTDSMALRDRLVGNGGVWVVR